ncbi:hypothetical protein BKA70DRAFT_1241429 [Coprinopsis sp. MPI-PUGE-AT-0042]|nr:hypothetical protein BKA70DRAFT_1241429 [Coprinopsis sp. MPI-PUGE-AT-0042]
MQPQNARKFKNVAVKLLSSLWVDSSEFSPNSSISEPAYQRSPSSMDPLSCIKIVRFYAAASVSIQSPTQYQHPDMLIGHAAIIGGEPTHSRRPPELFLDNWRHPPRVLLIPGQLKTIVIDTGIGPSGAMNIVHIPKGAIFPMQPSATKYRRFSHYMNRLPFADGRDAVTAKAIELQSFQLLPNRARLFIFVAYTGAIGAQPLLLSLPRDHAIEWRRIGPCFSAGPSI